MNKNLKNFNAVGFYSFVSVIFLCSVIMIQFSDYYHHYSIESKEPLKYFYIHLLMTNTILLILMKIIIIIIIIIYQFRTAFPGFYLGVPEYPLPPADLELPQLSS
jgi:hypothetical protein